MVMVEAMGCGTTGSGQRLLQAEELNSGMAKVVLRMQGAKVLIRRLPL